MKTLLPVLTLALLALAPSCLLAQQASDSAASAGRQQMARKLKAADANGDGLIQRSEAQASLPRLAEHFDALDANHDGALSREELRAAGQALSAARRGSGQ